MTAPTSECSCANCELPEGHPETPEIDDLQDIVIPRQFGKIVGHLVFKPADDEEMQS